MKTPQITAILLVFGIVCCHSMTTPKPSHEQQHLLGAKECTWGPSYWCQNITTAGVCRAVNHCIQTVWIHKQLPPDESNICQTCLDMVKQARDQLESNETQELIKEVFEGSCKLLHLKPVVEECDKIADEFVPELIETLASEMNPQVVCSVAGLCNNPRWQKLLLSTAAIDKDTRSADDCKRCYNVVEQMQEKLHTMPRIDVMQILLRLCGDMGTFSDACSAKVTENFDSIYDYLMANFNAKEICTLLPSCSHSYDTHPDEVEITPKSHIGYLKVQDDDDDLPCELCEQLVQHLKDLLIANTTEDEFKMVLEGICSQAKISFKKECLQLVDEYYSIIYNYLVYNLDKSVVCKEIGICPQMGPVRPIIMPLLPVDVADKALKEIEKSSAERLEPESAQLPIDLLALPHAQVYNPEVCALCEYILHYLQQYITQPKSEEEIKDIVEKICEKLPNAVNSSCVEFVNSYEPALVAILAQEIDPSTICPTIRACPTSNVKDVEIFMHQKGEGSKCPLCLLAIKEVEDYLKDNKTEVNIKLALKKVCTHLNGNLKLECQDFVDTYTNEIIEMLMSDFTPDEVCVYLNVCKDEKPPKVDDLMPIGDGDTETNAIPDNTIGGILIKKYNFNQIDKTVDFAASCELCKLVMKEIHAQLENNATEEEIENAVRRVCIILPKKMAKECADFVDEYGTTIIKLLDAATVPSEICFMMNLCVQPMNTIKVAVFDCAICETIVYVMEKVLANPSIDHTMEHVLEKTCRALPSEAKCLQFIKQYGNELYNLITHLADKGLVCKQMRLCATTSNMARIKRENQLLGSEKCTWGPSYWCKSLENANKCGALKHCQEKEWFAVSP